MDLVLILVSPNICIHLRSPYSLFSKDQDIILKIILATLKACNGCKWGLSYIKTNYRLHSVIFRLFCLSTVSKTFLILENILTMCIVKVGNQPFQYIKKKLDRVGLELVM